MLYSSCKAPFIESVQQLNIEVVKSVSGDIKHQIDENYMYHEKINHEIMVYRNPTMHYNFVMLTNDIMVYRNPTLH